jgi:hypothetical protein
LQAAFDLSEVIAANAKLDGLQPGSLSSHDEDTPIITITKECASWGANDFIYSIQDHARVHAVLM